MERTGLAFSQMKIPRMRRTPSVRRHLLGVDENELHRRSLQNVIHRTSRLIGSHQTYTRSDTQTHTQAPACNTHTHTHTHTRCPHRGKHRCTHKHTNVNTRIHTRTPTHTLSPTYTHTHPHTHTTLTYVTRGTSEAPDTDTDVASHPVQARAAVLARVARTLVHVCRSAKKG